MSHDVRVPGQRQYDPTEAFGRLLSRVDADQPLAEDLAQNAFLFAWGYIGRTEFHSRNIRSRLVAIARCLMGRSVTSARRP
ncbi:MAG: hypothetical protein JWQ32_3576 [Marmoricola sp.]|nr:hypothetical protein [Marmoricola sp.]